MPSLFPFTSQASLARRPFLALVTLVGLGLWLLDTHQPLPWPDAASPWSAYARALGPAAALVDWLNAIALTPDLPLGSALVLLVLAATTLATLLTLAIPSWLAIAAACGLVATRSVWSTVTPGDDALPVVLASLVVLVIARPARRLVAPAAAALVALAPPAAWLAIPLTQVTRTTAPRRTVLGLALAALITVAAHTAGAWYAWHATTCLPPSGWTSALPDVLRPGLSADGSPSMALRQALAVLVGDVHLFGLGVAAFGLAAAGAAHPMLRRATAVAGVVTVAAVVTGLLSPAMAASLLLPWWAPWFALGLLAIVLRQRGRQRRIAMAFVWFAALATPLLRHATVVAGPWVAGAPSMARALAHAWDGSTVASGDAVMTRRLRGAGFATVPLDRVAIASCLAAGATVTATGSSIARVEQWGFEVADQPLRVELGAAMADVRQDQLVALAVTPSSLPWAGPQGLAALRRVDVRRETLPTAAALAVIARTSHGGAVESARDRVEVSLPAGDDVGGRPLLAPLAVRATDAGAEIASGATQLAHGAHAAVVIFDRLQEAVLQSVAEAAPGLPISIAAHPQWRRVAVTGAAQCTSASGGWTALPWPAARISVPLASASRRTPLILYVASDDPPRLGVGGLATHPEAAAWETVTFDRLDPLAAARLHAAWQQDGIARTPLGAQRWIARLDLHASGTRHPDRASIAVGAREARWLVRLPGTARRWWTSDVCRMSAPGEPVLLGHYGAVDDDSVREIAVWMGTGWHAAERLPGAIHQWSAAPSATLTFRLARPRPLVLALDATAATPAAGPQRLSVRINGTIVHENWQGAGRLDVPATLVHAGNNEIALEVPQTVQPPHDPRPLGVLVRQLRLIEAQPR